MQPTEVGTHEAFSQITAINPVLRSIQRGIKRNDLTMILGSLNQTHLAPVRYDENVFDEEKEVHINLGQMKREFDNYHTAIIKKEKEISSLKTQLGQLKLEEDELLFQNGHLNKELLQARSDCELAKQSFEEAEMTDKSYKHMISRLKHDILCFKLKLNKMKEILERKRAEQHQAGSKQQYQIQYNLQTQKLLDEMMKNIELEHKDRERQLMLFKNQIKARQLAEKKREERIQQQMEIAEHASNDKDINEKKWRKLLLVHKFVHSLLKNKMEIEMRKFAVVEQAFQHIKTATGITEAQEVVQKFLTKEQIYGQLLGTIAESEKKIDHLKRKNENLKTKLQQLKDEVQVMEMAQKPSKKGLDSDLYKTLYAVDEKAKKAEVMQQKLYIWTVRMLSRLDVASIPHADERVNYYDMFERPQILELFKYFEEKILKEISAVKPEEVDRTISQLLRSNIREEMMAEDYNKRNIRVKFRKVTQRENRRRTRSIDSSVDLSNNSQVAHSSDSNASHSYYESSSGEDSVDMVAEMKYMNGVREELKGRKKQEQH